MSSAAALDDLIRYERENTTLDFKRVAYVSDQHEALLKDVMSMANAHASGDRYIVCGVTFAADGTCETRGRWISMLSCDPRIA